MLPKPIYIGGDPLSIQWINSSPGWYFDPRFMKQYPTTSTKGPQSAKFSQRKEKSFRYLSKKSKKEFTIREYYTSKSDKSIMVVPKQHKHGLETNEHDKPQRNTCIGDAAILFLPLGFGTIWGLHMYAVGK